MFLAKRVPIFGPILFLTYSCLGYAATLIQSACSLNTSLIRCYLTHQICARLFTYHHLAILLVASLLCNPASMLHIIPLSLQSSPSCMLLCESGVTTQHKEKHSRLVLLRSTCVVMVIPCADFRSSQ